MRARTLVCLCACIVISGCAHAHNSCPRIARTHSLKQPGGTCNQTVPPRIHNGPNGSSTSSGANPVLPERDSKGKTRRQRKRPIAITANQSQQRHGSEGEALTRTRRVGNRKYPPETLSE